MPFISTLALLAAVKTALEAIPHPDTALAAAGEKLFERVDFHENKKLREVLRDQLILKQRVAIIVPEGDSYENIPQARNATSVRTAQFALLIADRAWTRGGHDAVFGGTANLGVLAMKDQVVEALAANPQLGLGVGVLLQPQQGNEIELADDEVKDSPGRECYVLSYATWAGMTTLAPTTLR
jgi:hypothetical protein